MLINGKGCDLVTLHTWKYNWLDRWNKYTTLPEVKGTRFGNGTVDSVRNLISKYWSAESHEIILFVCLASMLLAASRGTLEKSWLISFDAKVTGEAFLVTLHTPC